MQTKLASKIKEPEMAARRTEATSLFETASIASDAATERVASMRKHYAKSDLNADGLSDLDLVLRELDMQAKEGRAVQNLYDRMMHEQTDHDRKVRAGAKRAEQDNRLAWSDHYVSHLVQGALYDLNVLLHKAETLPDRPKSTDLNSLKTAARDARRTIAEKSQNESMKVAEHWRAETWRLRDYVTASGRALHAKFSTADMGCACEGCELIVGMDADETPETEQAGS
jgi:hypothetical protein